MFAACVFLLLIAFSTALDDLVKVRSLECPPIGLCGLKPGVSCFENLLLFGALLFLVCEMVSHS